MPGIVTGTLLILSKNNDRIKLKFWIGKVSLVIDSIFLIKLNYYFNGLNVLYINF